MNTVPVLWGDYKMQRFCASSYGSGEVEYKKMPTGLRNSVLIVIVLLPEDPVRSLLLLLKVTTCDWDGDSHLSEAY